MFFFCDLFDLDLIGLVYSALFARLVAAYPDIPKNDINDMCNLLDRYDFEKRFQDKVEQNTRLNVETPSSVDQLYPIKPQDILRILSSLNLDIKEWFSAWTILRKMGIKMVRKDHPVFMKTITCLLINDKVPCIPQWQLLVMLISKRCPYEFKHSRIFPSEEWQKFIRN